MIENVLKIITTFERFVSVTAIYFTISFHNIEITILPVLLIIKIFFI